MSENDVHGPSAYIVHRGLTAPAQTQDKLQTASAASVGPAPDGMSYLPAGLVAGLTYVDGCSRGGKPDRGPLPQTAPGDP